jgi:hypothetical protein
MREERTVALEGVSPTELVQGMAARAGDLAVRIDKFPIGRPGCRDGKGLGLTVFD